MLSLENFILIESVYFGFSALASMFLIFEMDLIKGACVSFY